MLAWWALIAAAVSSAATVDLAVVVGRGVPAGAVSFEVRGQWLDAPVAVALTDAHGVSGDGLWTAELSGEPVRMLPLTLTMTSPQGEEVELARSTEMMDRDGGRITWALDGDPLTTIPRARRVALARPARQMERFEAASTAAGVAWLGLVFLYVAWWATDRARGGRSRRRGRG